MSDAPKLYIAGMGMITAVGANTAMTAAAVRAGISGYAESSFEGQHAIPITMALIPVEIFDEIDIDLIDGDRYDDWHNRLLKLAIVAIREACEQCPTEHAIPLVMVTPTLLTDGKDLPPFIPNLEQNCKPYINVKQTRQIKGGRSVGLEAISYIFTHIENMPGDYVLVGGSDSFQNYELLDPFIEEDRLLSRGAKDGFAPGEGACFLLLTPKIDLALERNGKVIAIHNPGIADETGHWGSDEPYRGDGLDNAFKKILEKHQQIKIDGIYSSMNGEQHWAKEYGVAYIRNKDSFVETVKIEHPADCYGDLGVATGTALLALAAEDLFKHNKATTCLVYSSSDTAKRAAVVIEKLTKVQAADLPTIEQYMEMA